MKKLGAVCLVVCSVVALRLCLVEAALQEKRAQPTTEERLHLIASGNLLRNNATPVQGDGSSNQVDWLAYEDLGLGKIIVYASLSHQPLANGRNVRYVIELRTLDRTQRLRYWLSAPARHPRKEDRNDRTVHATFDGLEPGFYMLRVKCYYDAAEYGGVLPEDLDAVASVCGRITVVEVGS